MSKYAKALNAKVLTLAATLTGMGFLGYGTHYTYHGYKAYAAPSPFELAAKRLGFNGYKQTITAAQQQEALLKQFQMAGYFKPENLWQTINHLGVKDPSTVFIKLYSAIKKSNADQSDPSKFNAKILRKNLAKGTGLDEQDVMDLILYIAQNAFNRKAGQERSELNSQDWMSAYKQDYLEAARLLRLIDREPPQQQNYDEAWIAGASRIGVLARLIDCHYIVSEYGINIKGDTIILAGARPLWAEIDGIAPSVLSKLIKALQTKQNLDTVDISLAVGKDEAVTREGQEYMAGLAQRSNIKLNPSSPFIQYKTKEECPPGYFPGRLYPNYADSEGRKLTETLMSQDLIVTYFPNTQPIGIIDTAAEKHQRPTTATTARDTAVKFVNNIISGKYGDQKEFVILFQANNPYIERQTIATQREVTKILKAYGLDGKGYKIKIEGVGFSCKQDIATIHSEFGALLTEKWKTAAEEQGSSSSPKRPIEKLLFQSRDNSVIMDPMPDITDVSALGNPFVEFFSEYLD